eukprot:TRINITY_DN8882_c0_g1_i1.p1 TRINITY_DN8882_c0_g1~~TRINITY_DN8882_c0_g1_i1.p1  ORF type:complete len:692 (-),score=80.13 TRINITY_DN8882_c0_g1_i1:8-1990(-)
MARHWSVHRMLDPMAGCVLRKVRKWLGPTSYEDEVASLVHEFTDTMKADAEDAFRKWSREQALKYLVPVLIASSIMVVKELYYFAPFNVHLLLILSSVMAVVCMCCWMLLYFSQRPGGDFLIRLCRSLPLATFAACLVLYDMYVQAVMGIKYLQPGEVYGTILSLTERVTFVDGDIWVSGLLGWVCGGYLQPGLGDYNVEPRVDFQGQVTMLLAAMYFLFFVSDGGKMLLFQGAVLAAYLPITMACAHGALKTLTGLPVKMDFKMQVETVLPYSAVLLAILVAKHNYDKLHRNRFLLLHGLRKQIVDERVLRCQAERGGGERMAVEHRDGSEVYTPSLDQQSIQVSVQSAPAKVQHVAEVALPPSCHGDGDCIPASFLVQVDGKKDLMKLASVHPGDRVLSWDGLTRTTQFVDVLSNELKTTDQAQWVTLVLADGTEMTVTEDHPIRVGTSNNSDLLQAESQVRAKDVVAGRHFVTIMKTEKQAVTDCKASIELHKGETFCQKSSLSLRSPDRYSVLVRSPYSSKLDFMALGSVDASVVYASQHHGAYHWHEDVFSEQQEQMRPRIPRSNSAPGLLCRKALPGKTAVVASNAHVARNRKRLQWVKDQPYYKDWEAHWCRCGKRAAGDPITPRDDLGYKEFAKQYNSWRAALLSPPSGEGM